jgi:hypothetical protein
VQLCELMRQEEQALAEAKYDLHEKILNKVNSKVRGTVLADSSRE